MRHSLLSLSLLSFVFIFAACGGTQQSEGGSAAKGDTAAVAADTVAAPAGYSLTADSFGPIRVGMRLDEIPQQTEGLYNTILPAETPDAMALTFVQGADPVCTVYDFGNGQADVIVLEGSKYGVATPDGELRIGDDFSKVLALPGVRSEWGGMDDYGTWYWVWQGIWFGVDEMEASDALMEALETGRHAPRAAELATARIGYIATGLPF